MLRTRHALAFTLSAALLLGTLPATGTGITGYYQVRKLELSYYAESQTLTAQVHLSTGPAIKWTATSEQEKETLLQFAQMFAQWPTKMSVTLEEDKVVSFQVSIP